MKLTQCLSARMVFFSFRSTVTTSITSGLTVSLLFHHSSPCTTTSLTYFLFVLLLMERVIKAAVRFSVVTVLVSSCRDVFSPPSALCCFYPAVTNRKFVSLLQISIDFLNSVTLPKLYFIFKGLDLLTLNTTFAE